MTDFTMPSLGADMDEGTLLEWLVKPGDAVHKGDILAVVDTAKAAVEVESFSDGVVGDLLVQPGTVVPVGTVLATLDGAPPAPPHEPVVSSPLVRREAEQLGVDLASLAGTGRGGAITRTDVARAAHPPTPAPIPAAPAPAAAPAAPPARKPPAPGERAQVTPYARNLARQLGVDLTQVDVAAGEPIRAADIRAAAGQTAPPAPAPAAAPTPAPTPGLAPEPAGRRGHEDRQDLMRRTIAGLMARAKREIPHYYLSTTVDLHSALRWMHARNRELPVTERLVPAALLLKATALATARAPVLNGFWVEDGFRPGTGVHLGIAVSLRGGGLVAPALHDADKLSIEQVMAGMRDVVARARAGRLQRAEMSDPTITVTNLGEQGVESVHGVIYPPQVALVGFGRIAERPWAVDGLLGVRPLVTLTLAADHRATDGFTGGRFLADIDQQLQHPEDL